MDSCSNHFLSYFVYAFLFSLFPGDHRREYSRVQDKAARKEVGGLRKVSYACVAAIGRNFMANGKNKTLIELLQGARSPREQFWRGPSS